MKENIILIVYLLFNIYSAKSQIVKTNPSILIDTDSVSIIFDASLGTGGLEGYTGDVYAHTGVVTDKSSNIYEWKYIIADWGVNIEKAKMKNLGNNKWELRITPDIRGYYGVPEDEKIINMAFVFRSATEVDGMWLEGKDDESKDIFVKVFEAGLNIIFNSPNNNISVEKDSTVHLDISASGNDSLFLYVDETLLSAVRSDNLAYDYMASDLGSHRFIAFAKNGNDSISDTISLFVKDTVVIKDLPVGMRDGINIVNDSTVCFVLFAPEKDNVFLIGDFTAWELRNEYQMFKDGERFWISVSSIEKEKEYIFQYIIDGDIIIADPYSEKISDPEHDAEISYSIYPDLISYPDGKTTEIASVFAIRNDDYSWQNTDFVPEVKDNLIIYELLIRDFTEEGSIRAAISKLDYLKDLGINAVELMPFNEFEGNDSWGYNPSFYFAPDKAYGTINDYKEFIDECHKRGIAVIMDMVLNHSYGKSPLVRMYFKNGKPSSSNPWYNENHNFENVDAHWGYDFNHESMYTKALVDSICSYWMTNYKIDGFRFDFTKGFSNTWHSLEGSDVWGSDYDDDRIRILKRIYEEIRKRKANAIIIFEHLATNSEEKELAGNNILLWGNMNYNFSQASMGYEEDSDLTWASYKFRGWNMPNLITYMESHDEERLMYRNINFGRSTPDYDIKELNTALERQELANILFLAIPGPKMIWQFGEIGYDYSIDYNGRLGKKPVKWDYFNIPERRKLYQTIKAMNYLRSKEQAFNSTNFELNVSSYTKQVQIKGSEYDVCVVGNFNVQSVVVSPMYTKLGMWYEYFSGDSINISTVGETIHLKAGEYKLFTTKSFAIPDIFSAPIAEEISVQGEVKEGKVLKANYKYYDRNGDEEGLSLYRWYRSDSSAGANMQLIDGATGMEYVLEREDVDKYICFKVIPVAVTGGLLIGKSYMSSCTEVVESALYVNEEKKDNLDVYLDYTERVVHITVDNNVRSIEFVDMLGKKVLVVKPSGRRKLEISMSDIEKGYYVVNFIFKDNLMESKKIVIIK